MNKLNVVSATQFEDMYLIGVVLLGGSKGYEISLPEGLKSKQQLLKIVDEGELYDRIMDSGWFPCVMADMTKPVFVCVNASDLAEVASELPQSQKHEAKPSNRPHFA